MLREFFKFAVISIRHRQLRSWLTVIGIVIGVAAIISLISIGQGMQQAISNQMSLMGTDNIIVMPGGGDFMSMGGLSTAKLTDSDIDLIKNVRGVETAVGMLYKTARITYGSEIKTAFVIGMPPDTKSSWFIKNFKIEGRYPQEGDRYNAVIGAIYPKAIIFKKALRLGSKFDIENQSFKVVGILQEIGNRQDDSQIYIPLEVARDIFNEPEEVGMVYAKVRTGYDPASVADDIEKRMRDDRDQKKGQEDFSVQTAEQLAQTMGNILGIVQTILVGIASIALLVGSIGIMNTMYTSVMERTKEIGVMKAIGAKNRDVLLIFLMESGLLGLIGGAFGVLTGIGMAKGAEVYARYAGYGMIKAALSPELIVLGLVFSFAIGAISGFMPARKASKLKPVDALRYE